MHSHHLLAAPGAEFAREGFAGRHRHIRPFDGLTGKPAFHQCVDPHRIVAARAHVARKILGCIERIARQKDLRHGRIPERKIARRNQYLRSAVLNEPGKRCLLVVEALQRIGEILDLDERDIFESCEFSTQAGVENDGCL